MSDRATRESITADDFVMVDKAGSLDSTGEDHLSDISGHIDLISKDLRDISLSIHDNPELQYKEFHAHEVLTEYLQKQEGWQVTPSAYDIATAFVAVFDKRTSSEDPTVSFNAEYGTLDPSRLCLEGC